jgi:periplasmic divalent cation tolerance protein
MEKVLIVQTTFDDREEAGNFARKVVHKRLAACAQLSGEVESFYWWNNGIEQSGEVILSMKTLDVMYSKLEAYINATHSYETPEILAIPVEHVGTGYVEWLHREILKSE